MLGMHVLEMVSELIHASVSEIKCPDFHGAEATCRVEIVLGTCLAGTHKAYLFL